METSARRTQNRAQCFQVASARVEDRERSNPDCALSSRIPRVTAESFRAPNARARNGEAMDSSETSIDAKDRLSAELISLSHGAQRDRDPPPAIPRESRHLMRPCPIGVVGNHEDRSVPRPEVQLAAPP